MNYIFTPANVPLGVYFLLHVAVSIHFEAVHNVDGKIFRCLTCRKLM